jgi:hypothetical protein
MDRKVVRRVWLSKWVALISYSDGSCAIQQGTRNHVNLSALETAYLMNALLTEKPTDENALYRQAKQEEAGYRAFLDDMQDNEQYKHWLEHANDPRASEY